MVVVVMDAVRSFVVMVDFVGSLVVMEDVELLVSIK